MAAPSVTCCVSVSGSYQNPDSIQCQVELRKSSGGQLNSIEPTNTYLEAAVNILDRLFKGSAAGFMCNSNTLKAAGSPMRLQIIRQGRAILQPHGAAPKEVRYVQDGLNLITLGEGNTCDETNTWRGKICR
jgi:hypothetical protein